MRVVKRILKFDSMGKPIRTYQKEMAADTEGNIITDIQHRLELCENCRKPILSEEDIQGSCAFCGIEICSVCAIRCSGCGALLCQNHSISLPPENKPLCPRCAILKVAYDQAMLELKVLEHYEIDFPGALGLLAKLRKNVRLRRIEKKVRRLSREARFRGQMLPSPRPKLYPIVGLEKERKHEGATQNEGRVRDRG
jgi:hypothetical protein